MLDVCPDHARRRLRSQCPAFPLGIAAAGADPEQLLLDDVRHGADAPLEDLRLLEQRRLDGLVAVAVGQAAGDALESQEGDPLGGQQVTGAPGGLGSGHRWKSTDPDRLRRWPHRSHAVAHPARWRRSAARAPIGGQDLLVIPLRTQPLSPPGEADPDPHAPVAAIPRLEHLESLALRHLAHDMGRAARLRPQRQPLQGRAVHLGRAAGRRAGRAAAQAQVDVGGEPDVQAPDRVALDAAEQGAHGLAVADIDADVAAVVPDDDVTRTRVGATGLALLAEAVEVAVGGVEAADLAGQLRLPEGPVDQARAVERVGSGAAPVVRLADLAADGRDDPVRLGSATIRGDRRHQTDAREHQDRQGRRDQDGDPTGGSPGRDPDLGALRRLADRHGCSSLPGHHAGA